MVLAPSSTLPKLQTETPIHTVRWSVDMFDLFGVMVGVECVFLPRDTLVCHPDMKRRVIFRLPFVQVVFLFLLFFSSDVGGWLHVRVRYNETSHIPDRYICCMRIVKPLGSE